jgi:hypothetical protein
MNAIAPEVWARLANEQVRGETLWARRAAPDITERLVAALDSDGKRHLLILLMPSESNVEDSQSRGIDVATRELAMSNHAPGRYLDITCHDATGHQAFDLIGKEMADRLATNSETAPEIVTRVLAKWRRFWGQSPRQLLSREKQIGLFAEVWFLTYWLIPRFGVDEAIAKWRGPFGSRHDFEWTGRSVEVKATTSTRGRIHRINGLDQLAPPDDGILFCFSLQLREEAGATNSLPSVMAVCRALAEDHANALSLFESALSQAEYSPANEGEYGKMKFRVVDQGLYAVRDGFPRLTQTEFPTGLPPGVEHVEYDINLGGFAHLCIARQPAEASAL